MKPRSFAVGMKRNSLSISPESNETGARLDIFSADNSVLTKDFVHSSEQGDKFCLAVSLCFRKHGMQLRFCCRHGNAMCGRDAGKGRAACDSIRNTSFSCGQTKVRPQDFMSHLLSAALFHYRAIFSQSAEPVVIHSDEDSLTQTFGA
jgi:hypothetical protein